MSTQKKSVRLGLLICGYVREEERKLQLYMNIPNGIVKIVHELFPLLLFKFGDFNRGRFEINDDRTIIKGPHNGSCNGFLIYADLEQYSDVGLNKGIHIWSIKRL